jgi:hypothetical protein
MKVAFSGIILLSILSVLLGLGLVCALSFEFQPQNFSPVPSIAKGVNEEFELELSLAVEKITYYVGEPINVTLTVTNIGNRTFDFEAAPSWWNLLVYNDTSSGSNAIFEWHYGQMFPMYVSPVPLDPGMGLTHKVMVWPQTSNDTISEFGFPGSPVPPGSYYLVGKYGFSPAVRYNLITTPLQVTIVQP